MANHLSIFAKKSPKWGHNESDVIENDGITKNTRRTGWDQVMKALFFKMFNIFFTS